MHSYNHVLPTPEDVAAARSYLKWSQEELANRAELGKKTLTYLENRKTKPTQEVLEKIQQVFLKEGIIFQPAGGFLANQSTIRIFEGLPGVIQFFESVYSDIKDDGCDIFISGVDEKDFVEVRARAGMDVEDFRNRMSKVQNLNFKVIISEHADKSYLAKHIEYRAMLDEDYQANVPFYIYQNKVALILWGEVPRIIVHNDKKLADAFLSQFRINWKRAKPVSVD